MNQVVTAQTAKQFFDKPSVQQKLQELMGKNASAFATSVLQIVNSNDLLRNADPQTVFSAACMAATLNLPINNTLGFAYIVPFKNKKLGKVEAQFQLGYKGFIQLAQRSGQFERLVALPVYADQLISKDPINGFVFDWSKEPAANEKPAGYYAYFKLINGFTAELYMTKAEVDRHANKYSQTYKMGFGVWKDNFEAMALKTVMKLLLSKQAPLSIDMQKAQLADQAVVRDVDGEIYEHIDNTPMIEQTTIDVTEDPELFAAMCESIKSGALDKNDVLSGDAGYVYSDEQRMIVESLTC